MRGVIRLDIGYLGIFTQLRSWELGKYEIIFSLLLLRFVVEIIDSTTND